ncbi:MAG: DUF72 domain-containing protein [Proteobacteria bacterium]|nr:MAG: DUF72 domain-containing protein [Pseudomonadota bacterium]
MKNDTFRIGTAAWAVPKALTESFSGEGSHLERYSQVLNAVEINTSFYRDHKADTYEKWAKATPDHFRFAVKLSKVFTHEDQLAVDPQQLQTVVEGIMRLGEKLAVILIQLPPKLAFHEVTVRRFFELLRSIYQGPIVLEPRHKTWVSPEALIVLKDFHVGKVMADPEPCPAPIEFQKATHDICYLRWHGSPVIYESRYEAESMEELKTRAKELSRDFKEVWIIFDNTTFAWATVNALEMKALLMKNPRRNDLGLSPAL